MELREEKILGHFNNLSRKNMVNRLTMFGFSTQCMQDCLVAVQQQPLTRIEDLRDLLEHLGFGSSSVMKAQEILDVLWERYDSQDNEKKIKKLVKFQRRTANRAEYIPEPVYLIYWLKDQERPRIRFTRDRMMSAGLLSRIITEENLGDDPVMVGLQVQLDDKLRDLEKGELLEFAEERIKKFRDADVAISNGRLGWNMKSPAWKILKQAFPDDVSMGAYCHSLNAPVLPNTFRKVKVVFQRIEANGIDLETDGSGIYHPDCPDMQEFVAHYGAVPCQIRFLEPKTGIFAKGVIVPAARALVDGQPSICLDWRQIKGRHKKLAKQRREEGAVKSVEMYMGVLQTWGHRRAYMSAGFEMLENIAVNARTIELTEDLISESMDLMKRQGLHGLAAQTASGDPTLEGLLELLNHAEMAGCDVRPWHLERFRAAMMANLSHTLWNISQGGAVKTRSYVCLLDATIPEGKVVVSDIKPGTKVGAYRFPMVLAQGLVSAETMETPDHLKIKTGEDIVTYEEEEIYNEITGEWEAI